MKTTIILLFFGYFLIRSRAEELVLDFFETAGLTRDIAFVIGSIMILIALWRIGGKRLKKFM